MHTINNIAKNRFSDSVRNLPIDTSSTGFLMDGLDSKRFDGGLDVFFTKDFGE